eukprot:TRINITY_DN66359_c0_g1_i2.p1 TRINITY_DN66359_c0_g1~~TRINITY_DN66359_c0_g1_i2.p1  ORF type:complete len:172 (-),score=11.48 TRINITY_DN66359_c0_g1_i2:292-807(-)
MEPEPAALTVCLLDGTAVEVATTSGCPAAQLRKELAAKLEQGVLLVSGDCELRDADALPDAMITAICLPHAVSVWNDWAIAVATDHVRHGRGQFCWGSFDRTHTFEHPPPLSLTSAHLSWHSTSLSVQSANECRSLEGDSCTRRPTTCEGFGSFQICRRRWSSDLMPLKSF